MLEETVGETLKARRIAVGKSVATVASELWCSARFVYMVEKGDRTPNHRTLDCLMRILDVDAATAQRLHDALEGP